MHTDPIPTPLARATMRFIPAPMLQKMIDTLLVRMRQAHPALFRNLQKLTPAVIGVDPVDLPHRFLLAYNQDSVTLTIAADTEVKLTACIKGKLDSLLNLLEGRVDGDTMFFSRGIEITGDTSAVVALRNTIDREEIDLMNDVTGLFGPFARPVREAALLIDKIARRVKSRIEEIYEESPASVEAHAAKAECEKLRGEVQSLKTSLAKMDVHRQRTEASAS